MALLTEEYAAPEGNSSFEPVPAGTYDVVIHSAEVRTPKSGEGKQLSIRADIEGPTHQGRVLWENLTLRGSEQGQAVGRALLAQIMAAHGLTLPLDSDRLHGLRLRAVVTIRTQEGYEPRNQIKRWLPPGGAAPVGITQQSRPAVAQTGGRPPFLKG